MNKKLADNFNAGYVAFSRVQEFESTRFGKRYRQVANPMKKNTTPYREWQRGWEAAYFKNLEQLNGLGTRG
jgi:hypothetical protein